MNRSINSLNTENGNEYILRNKEREREKEKKKHESKIIQIQSQIHYDQNIQNINGYYFDTLNKDLVCQYLLLLTTTFQTDFFSNLVTKQKTGFGILSDQVFCFLFLSLSPTYDGH